MNMELTRTVTVKLNASVEEILPTLEAYTTIYNHVCKVGWDDKDFNGISLHQKTYATCVKPGFSQLTISARMKAVESLKSVRSLLRKGQKVSCPQAKQMSVRYDARSFSIINNTISLSTIRGRRTFNYQVPPFFDDYKTWRRRSAELTIRKNKVLLAIVFETTIPDTQPTDKTIGIDRGVKNIAVTSTNKFYNSRNIKKVSRHYESLRARLQAKGTQSAKRHLRKLSKKENRFKRDANHCISKKIVKELAPGTTIVLEDLKNIRKSSKKFRKKERKAINKWPFYQLELFLKYKAENAGCSVEYVDARYTSQKCSKCGDIRKVNRPTQSSFKCRNCGFSLNADLNAARNINKNYRETKGLLCRASVNKPIVTVSD